MTIDRIDNEGSSHVAQFDEDPVLARVQESLSSSGSNFGSYVIPPDQSGAQGAQIMNQLAGLTVSQPQGGGATATGGSPSTAPAWIMAGVGLVGAVAGGVAGAMSGGGTAAAAPALTKAASAVPAANSPPPAPASASAKPAASVSTATVSGNSPAPAPAPAAPATPPTTIAAYTPDFGQTLELSGPGSGAGRENLVQWSR